MAEPRSETVAVVGLGAMGLAGVKNLLEEGFQVTGFERSGYIGGLWHYTDQPGTLSVIEDTVTNVAINRACFTDFPFPKETPTYVPAKDVEEYLEGYADHFNLRPHLRLNTGIKRILRDDDSGKWQLSLADGSSETFDKVVMAIGPHVEPMVPQFEGAEIFEGQIVHARDFKKPDAFKGREVVVLGLGNSGADVAQALVGKATTISISHSHGAVVMPRYIEGRPPTDVLTHRRLVIQSFIARWLPSLAEKSYNKRLVEMMTKAFGIMDSAWGLLPAPSVLVTNPVISDSLIPNLQSGAVKSVSGIKKIVGPRLLELNTGETIAADAIICCTGYKSDFSILDPRFDPTTTPSPIWEATPGSKGRRLPRLYQNVFSLSAPDSLAFLGCVWFATGAFCLADIVSMCIAQVWAGHTSLPPATQREAWMQQQEERVSRLAMRGSVIPAAVPQTTWLRWADEVAGAEIESHLGWGWTGWVFWWRERSLWRLLMDGMLTAAVWRLFEGKRRRWEGAKGEIERINALATAR